MHINDALCHILVSVYLIGTKVVLFSAFQSFLNVGMVHLFNAAMSHAHSKDVHLAIKFEALYYLKLLVLAGL